MKISKEFAELAGILYGDGCLSFTDKKYLVYFCGHKDKDFEYHNSITKGLLFKVFNKNVSIGIKEKENVLFIKFGDKKIFNCFKELGMPVGKKLDKLKIPHAVYYDKKLITPFIRGIFDTDGCVVFSKQHRKTHYYPRIEITNKSKNFLQEILSELNTLGFYGSVSNKGNSYRLELPGFDNLKNWLALIGINNPKHIKKIEAQLGPFNASAQSVSQPEKLIET